MSWPIAYAACENIPAKPSRIVEYFGTHPSSAFAFAFERGIRIDVMRAMYGAISRGSHPGTLNGAGNPEYSAIASTIWLMLTA